MRFTPNRGWRIHRFLRMRPFAMPGKLRRSGGLSVAVGAGRERSQCEAWDAYIHADVCATRDSVGLPVDIPERRSRELDRKGSERLGQRQANASHKLSEAGVGAQAIESRLRKLLNPHHAFLARFFQPDER